MDDLALLETFELEHMQNRYKDQIRHARRAGDDTGYFETELSYVQRELHVREQRNIFLEKMYQQGYHPEMGV
jgi:DNA invertase Pin-like site-specific DNA recombinase